MSRLLAKELKPKPIAVSFTNPDKTKPPTQLIKGA